MSELDEDSDCVVIGGGPAGSAFAGIAARHAPGAKIVVLERARFPRHRVGESTIPVANTVLRELGVFDTLYNGGAVKKVGISFVWGRDRTPWNADYLKIGDARGQVGADRVIDVVGQDFSAFSERFGPSETPFVAFNVDRARFDALLLDRARELGAECREETEVMEVLRDGDAVSGVRFRDARGRAGTIRTRFVLDASGLNAELTHGQRVRDVQMNNFAVYGYFAGARWKSTLSGTRAATTVFIASVSLGWIWYFPIGEDVMSVGFVTHRDRFRDRLREHERDLEGLYREAIASCPEIRELLLEATLRDDVLPHGQRVQAVQDWSSWAECPVGPGWAAAGDAAVFVDPILSSGVTMALQSGHRAAYTWLTCRQQPELDETALWRAYADYVRGEASAFLQLARFFYGNNRAAESWWWEAHRVMNARGQLDLDPQQAFTLATAGFFPAPRAIGLEIVAPLIEHLASSAVDLMSVYANPGLARSDIAPSATLEPVTRFRLALRAEPRAQTGRLDTYFDLVTDDPAYAHRLAIFPSRIAPALEPVVRTLQEPTTVADLLARAQTLLGPRGGAEDEIREATLELVRRAVIKGFARLVAS